MYINALKYRNVGPIEKVDVRFRKNLNGVPVPAIFVGENGSGKSVLLSNIVDSFYTLANAKFNNVMQPDGSGSQYYKTISPSEIHLGKEFLTAHIRFQQENNLFEYLFKSGNLSFGQYRNVVGEAIDRRLDWKDGTNYKGISASGDYISDVFTKEIVCYFGAHRYTKPFWMGDKYYQEDKFFPHFSADANFNGYLKNPITDENNVSKTLQWLFDVIADSRADLTWNGASCQIDHPSTNDIILLSIARKNAEEIMSAILGCPVIFRMRNRSTGNRRFAICRTDGTEIVPSLDSLSTGQLALFNMFATIIRYADNEDINLSLRLKDIKGIVVIDEIELHLHSNLQRNVLPKLIAKFPKVQFVITSHSPLFLLGMKEVFGEENFDIYEMPTASKISAEQFTEFEKAYRFYAETEKHQKEISAAIESKKEKPLIITEGATDWKHMKAAYNHLLSDERCSSWLPQLQFDFLEYEPQNSKLDAKLKLQMSNSHLCAMCEQFRNIPQQSKMIYIADRDDNNTNKKLGATNGNSYRDHGNNVFSFCLPVPDHRKDTPEICIEHYYTDEEIKREISYENGIIRRIFMGNEFNEKGFSISPKGFYCPHSKCCGPNKIDIIDGSDPKKVFKPMGENDEINYAMTKMDFANHILNGDAPFDNIDFSAFIPLFEVIRDILNS